jgi:hypothetical protein
MSDILKFYRVATAAPCGESLFYILNTADDEWLERTHNYIQWLFPVPEPSQAVPGSPVLTAEDIEAFKSDVALRIRAFAALYRMVWFYASGFGWISPRNHNYLRITRIIRFFVLIGESGLAEWFHRTMVQLGEGEIDSTTLWYWDEALNPNPAWLKE